MRSYRWLSAAETHPGNVRRVNEDACLNLPDSGLWVVADGMGGHRAGDVASKAVVEAMTDAISNGSLKKRLEDASRHLQQCNISLILQARETGAQIIGSTVVALLCVDGQAACVWAGDSRAYRLRSGRLEQVTEDHSRVQEMISSGALNASEARHHPENNVVTRAVGATEVLEPSTVMLDVQANDVFLLCSDGLTGELTDTEIEKLLGGGDCQRVVDILVDEVLTRKAKDNVSIIVIQVHDDSPTEFASGVSESSDDATEDRTIIRE